MRDQTIAGLLIDKNSHMTIRRRRVWMSLGDSVGKGIMAKLSNPLYCKVQMHQTNNWAPEDRGGRARRDAGMCY